MYSYSWDIEGDYLAAKEVGKKIVMSFSYENTCNCPDTVTEPEWAKRLAGDQKKILQLTQKMQSDVSALRAAWDGSLTSVGLPANAPAIPNQNWCAGWTWLIANMFKYLRENMWEVAKDVLIADTLVTVTAIVANPLDTAIVAVGETALIPLEMIGAVAAPLLIGLGVGVVVAVYLTMTDNNFIENVACRLNNYMRDRPVTKANVQAGLTQIHDSYSSSSNPADQAKAAILLGCIGMMQYDENFFQLAVGMRSALDLPELVAADLCNCDDAIVYDFRAHSYSTEWHPEINVCGNPAPMGNYYAGQGWADADHECPWGWYSGIELTLDMGQERALSYVKVEYTVTAPGNATFEGSAHLRTEQGGSDFATKAGATGDQVLEWSGVVHTRYLNFACNDNVAISEPASGDVYIRKVTIRY
jgi:hypothetical protein